MVTSAAFSENLLDRNSKVKLRRIEVEYDRLIR